MRSAIDARAAEEKGEEQKRGRPIRAEDYPAAKRLRNECIHCHQVYEFARDQRVKAGQWDPAERWVYPLPENVGLTLDVDRGDHVKAVLKASAAEKAGLAPGDVIQRVNAIRVGSQADFQYGLHRAPWKGEIPIVWKRDGKEMTARLTLADGWRKTNLTWRPSLLELFPSLTVYGEDLTAAEKKKLSLPASRLAFRQQEQVHSQARAAGIRAGDIILGLDGEEPRGTVEQFLAQVRRNYLIGDRIKLVVLRDGKRVVLPMTLK